MEGRKLVKHGEATMMISLPSKWLKNNNLSKGDELNVIEKGSEITFSAKKDKKIKRQIEINISSMTESSLRNMLTNSYRLGYDRVIVYFLNNIILKTIEDITRNYFIGFEIIEKDSKKCVIENITEPSEDQFDNIFSKILLNIDSIFDILKEVLNGKKLEFESTERQLLSFENFCRRVISKKSDSTDKLQWVLHAELGHAQRELYFALKVASKNKINGKDAQRLLEECKKMYNTLKQAYLKKDNSLIEEIHDMEKKIIYKEGYEIIKKCKDPNERIIIHHILNSVRNLYLASSPLAGILMYSLIK